MKWVVDMQQEITLMKELVVDAPTRADALDYAKDLADEMCVVFGSDDTEWDECESSPVVCDKPVRLLCRRTAMRLDAYSLMSNRHCDNCDGEDVDTVAYGDARVCVACLAVLPGLTA